MQYTFFKITAEGSHIAGVDVSCSEAGHLEIELSPEIAVVDASEFGESLERGVRTAHDFWIRRGGTPHHVRVERVLFYPADSTQDAMECAATMATWLTLGGSKDQLRKSFDGDRWGFSLVDGDVPSQ